MTRFRPGGYDVIDKPKGKRYNASKDKEDMKMKYLNAHKEELFEGKKIAYRGKVYWANMTTREIYAQSDLAEIGGSINGYKVADITDDWQIVPPMKRYTIKPEYLSLWGEDCTEDTVIDTAEVERLAAEWETPIEELLEQLIEVDD